MTKEEIKDELYRMLSEVVNGGYTKRNNTQRGRYREAVKEAIESLEQEPCEDAISRQAVLKAIKNLYPGIPVVDINGARLKWLRKYEPYFECEKVVEQLPSVTPQPKIGHWIETYSEIDAKYSRHSYKCSECGEFASYFVGGLEDWWDLEKPNYCPNCGAKM